MKGSVEEGSDLTDLRCCCGSLIARIIKDHVEIKCRRCKRIHRIPIENGAPARPTEASEGWQRSVARRKNRDLTEQGGEK